MSSFRLRAFGQNVRTPVTNRTSSERADQREDARGVLTDIVPAASDNGRPCLTEFQGYLGIMGHYQPSSTELMIPNEACCEGNENYESQHPIQPFLVEFNEQKQEISCLRFELIEEKKTHQDTRNLMADMKSKLTTKISDLETLAGNLGKMERKLIDKEYESKQLHQRLQESADQRRVLQSNEREFHERMRIQKQDFANQVTALNERFQKVLKTCEDKVPQSESSSDTVIEKDCKDEWLTIMHSIIESCETCKARLAEESA